jgi:hypothetical protein
MSNTLIQLFPKHGVDIVLVLFLSFLIGLEREDEKVASEQYGFGGVRTFPLLGLLGYALCQAVAAGIPKAIRGPLSIGQTT